VKLAIREKGSVELERRVRGGGLVSSVLAITEVGRAVVRTDRARPRDAGDVLRSVTLVDLDASILRAAATLIPPALRSLDAIHLATALAVAEDLEAFVTYDRQLGRAARAAGFVVERPV
jgi:predicted nucleic acid-binding protein